MSVIVSTTTLSRHEVFGMKTALLERGPWGRNHVRWPDATLADFILKDLAGLPALLREIKRES
jgi:hypothetical protein